MKYWDRKYRPDEDVFVQDSTYARHRLKARLLKSGLVPYRCGCGITDMWNGSPIVLELDHINGVNNDNRIENLRFLCPNCHSQQPTNSAKNIVFQRQCGGTVYTSVLETDA